MPPQPQTLSGHRPQGRSNCEFWRLLLLTLQLTQFQQTAPAALRALLVPLPAHLAALLVCKSPVIPLTHTNSCSVAGQPNTQQQAAQAGAGQAGGPPNGNGGANGNGAGNGAGNSYGGNGGGSGGDNRAADFWNPPLPGADGFGNSSPGESFGGPSRRYTYVEPTSPRSTGRPVVHKYPNGAANRSTANGTWPPRRN